MILETFQTMGLSLDCRANRLDYLVVSWALGLDDQGDPLGKRLDDFQDPLHGQRPKVSLWYPVARNWTDTVWTVLNGSQKLSGKDKYFSQFSSSTPVSVTFLWTKTLKNWPARTLLAKINLVTNF